MRRLHGRSRRDRRTLVLRVVAACLIVLLIVGMAVGGIMAGVG